MMNDKHDDRNAYDKVSKYDQYRTPDHTSYRKCDYHNGNDQNRKQREQKHNNLLVVITCHNRGCRYRENKKRRALVIKASSL